MKRGLIMAKPGETLPMRQRFANALVNAEHEASKTGVVQHIVWRPDIRSGMFGIHTGVSHTSMFALKFAFATVYPDGQIRLGPCYDEELLKT